MSAEKPLVTFVEAEALNWVARSCLKSALRAGHSVNIYTYNDLENVPNGVAIKAAWGRPLSRHSATWLSPLRPSAATCSFAFSIGPRRIHRPSQSVPGKARFDRTTANSRHTQIDGPATSTLHPPSVAPRPWRNPSIASDMAARRGG